MEIYYAHYLNLFIISKSYMFLKEHSRQVHLYFYKLLLCGLNMFQSNRLTTQKSK